MRAESTRFTVVTLLFSLVLLTTGASAQDQPPLTHRLTAIEPPSPAPALKLIDLDEEIVDIADLKGKVIVVNFWATWCPPCRREMGSLERLYKATRDKGVEVLAVNIGEDLDTVFSFLGTVEPSPGFPMLLDGEGATMSTWQVRGLPTTYIVDPDGNLAYRAIGGRKFDHQRIKQRIIALTR